MLFPHTFGIVVVMKNEAPYVKEWLDYHLNAGVDIVYLYDNDSEDNLEEIVSPYINNGRVIYHKAPGKVPQLRCYHDALQRYRYSCKYMMFIDADEFLFPVDGGSVADFAEDFFESENDLAVLHIYYYLFGSNGEEKADFSRGVLERFQRRDKNTCDYEKSLINPRLASDFVDTPNAPMSYADTNHVNELWENVLKAKTCPGEKIFVAHFSAKSKEEWILRHRYNDVFFEKTSENSGAEKLNMKKFDSLDKNDVEDNRVYEYYLKNLDKPAERKIVKISDCVKNALEILNSKNINMEEYFSALHILKDGKYFEKKNKTNQLKKLLRESFANVLNNITAYYMELFLEEIPFMLKYDIMDKAIMKKIANIYYNTLQMFLILNGNFLKASKLRANINWLNNI